MRTCGGGGTRETAVVGSLLLCCTCARGLRMPPCLSCSWKFPLSAEIAPCVAGVEIRGRARRPAVVSLSCTRLLQNLHRERKARERKNTALRPLLLVPSARLATSVERKGEARQGAGGRNGMRNGRERKRRQGRERPGRDGGRPLVGRASEFRPPSLWDSFASSLWGKNGCARYSNRREREGRTALGTPSASWCYSCSVARFESRVG